MFVFMTTEDDITYLLGSTRLVHVLLRLTVHQCCNYREDSCWCNEAVNWCQNCVKTSVVADSLCLIDQFPVVVIKSSAWKVLSRNYWGLWE